MYYNKGLNMIYIVLGRARSR